MPVLSSRVSYDGGQKDNLDVPIERGAPPLPRMKPQTRLVFIAMQGRGLTPQKTSPPSPSSTFFFPRSLAGPLSPPKTQPQTPTLFFLCFSISASSPIKYILYFGYDAGDRVFDNAKARESMDKMISAVVRGLPVEWRWFKYAVFSLVSASSCCKTTLGVRFIFALQIQRHGGQSFLDL